VPTLISRSTKRLAFHPAKLAFPGNEFPRSVDMLDAIFKLAVALGQFCDHRVEPGRRVDRLGLGISDALAENELVGHVGVGPTRRLDFTSDEVSARRDDVVSIKFRVCNYRIALNARLLRSIGVGAEAQCNVRLARA
jgi:hypothetical protein